MALTTGTSGNDSSASASMHAALALELAMRKSFSSANSKINLSGPIWTAPKDKYKGWSVLTGILGNPILEDCRLKELHIRHHTSGKRDMSVIVASKDGESCQFRIVSTCKLPLYDSIANELKVLKLPNLLDVKKGYYVGISGEKSGGGIQVKSLSVSSHGSMKGHTIYYGDHLTAGTKTLKAWTGSLQFGFVAGEGEAAKRAAAETALAATVAAEAADSSS